jgi:hypothetical protein
LFLFLVRQKSTDSYENRSDTLKYDPISYDDILIEKHETTDRIKYDECQEKESNSRNHDNRMIRESERGFGFEFLLTRIGQEKETKNDINKDDDIPNISHMDAESISRESRIHDREPVEKEREKREENTNRNNPSTSRKMEEIEAHTNKEVSYFIF